MIQKLQLRLAIVAALKTRYIGQKMLVLPIYFSLLSPSHEPSNLNIKEGRLHKHLLKWNGVGSPYAVVLV